MWVLICFCDFAFSDGKPVVFSIAQMIILNEVKFWSESRDLVSENSVVQVVDGGMNVKNVENLRS